MCIYVGFACIDASSHLFVAKEFVKSKFYCVICAMLSFRLMLETWCNNFKNNCLCNKTELKDILYKKH